MQPMTTTISTDNVELANMGSQSQSSSVSTLNDTNSYTTYKPVSDPSLLPRKTSKISGASSNLVNSIVGAGIIGIPFALDQSGLVSGVFLLLMVGYFTDKSLRMMIELATVSPKLRDGVFGPTTT